MRYGLFLVALCVAGCGAELGSPPKEAADQIGQDPVSQCAGGECTCGTGRCRACCEAGYHPACTNCGTNQEKCQCLKNRGTGDRDLSLPPGCTWGRDMATGEWSIVCETDPEGE